MKDMKKWLDSLYAQLKSKGLTNPDDKPEDVPCGTCDSPIPYTWKSEGRFQYWNRGVCAPCKEADRLERKEKRRCNTLKIAGVPPGFWSRTLDNPFAVDSRNEGIANRVARWRSPEWVIAAGPVGTGKTSWLTSLFNTVICSSNYWAGSRWVTESSLFEQADIAHDQHGYTARQASVAPFIRAPLLLLDDIGASRRTLTEWQGSAMRNLFDVRYSNGLPTLMTSNITSPRDLTSRYGGHIYSRMMSASGGITHLGGSDRRMNG